MQYVGKVCLRSSFKGLGEETLILLIMVKWNNRKKMKTKLGADVGLKSMLN